MKNALIIALALSTVTAFAGTKVSKEARKEAMTACKAEGKTKKALKSCVKEKLHSQTAAVSEAAPATEAPVK